MVKRALCNGIMLKLLYSDNALMAGHPEVSAGQAVFLLFFAPLISLLARL